MRWLKMLGGTIVLVCASMWVFAYMRTQSFHTSVPETAMPSVIDMPTTHSTISLPVRVSLKTIQDALNNGLPPNGEEKEANTIDFLKDDTSRTIWTRDTLSLSADASKMTIAAALRANYRVDFKIDLLIADAKSHAEADAKGSASISLAPIIQENWTIKPNLSSFQVDLEQAQLTAAGITTSVRTLASNAIKKFASRKLTELEEKITSDDKLRTTISKKWAELCASRRVGKADSSMPPVYLEIQPVAASAAQPTWDTTNIDFLFAIKANISLRDVETTPSCHFPDKLMLTPPQPNGEFSLNVPINYSFESINEGLKRGVSGRSFTDASRGIEIQVRSLKVSPASNRLLVATDVTVKKSGILGFFDGRASGKVYLLAKPVLDSGTKTIRLEDVRMNSDSEKALSNTFGQLAVAAIEGVLSRETGFSYAKEIETVRSKANTALADLAAKPGLIKIDVAVTDLNAKDLIFDKDRLIVVAVANGTAKSEIVQIGAVAP